MHTTYVCNVYNIFITEGVDYDFSKEQNVTIPANETTIKFNITILDDDVCENETFKVEIEPTDHFIKTNFTHIATVTIIDDEKCCE